MTKHLWTEKYRPNTLSEYVWRDEGLRLKVNEWLRDGYLPNLLFHGEPGVGKTSLAWLLMKELRVQSGDIMFISASRDRKADVIGEKIVNFVNTWALGDMKYVILDEADAITPLVQKTLRTDMETYEGQVRIIATANYPNKLIPALHSRFQSYQFVSLPYDEFMLRLTDIMEAEQIDIQNEANLEVLLRIADSSYPDLRKCINVLDQSCITDADGQRKLIFNESVESTKDYLLEATAMIKAGRLNDARSLIVSRTTAEEYPELFRWTFRNLNLWGETEDQKDAALLVIRKGLVHHATVADPEINFSAMLVELKMIWAQTH